MKKRKLKAPNVFYSGYLESHWDKIAELEKKNMKLYHLKTTYVLNIDTFKLYCLSDYKMTDNQKDIATTLINDGWYGTFDELIECVKNLTEESDNMCCEISHKCDCNKKADCPKGHNDCGNPECYFLTEDNK